MPPLSRFLDPSAVSLKICGVTTRADAEQLITLGIPAIGLNFWDQSKRYLLPSHADWLVEMRGRVLRVGVFVNAPPELPLRLYHAGLIDVVQLHGDESPDDAASFRDANIPFIKAIGVKSLADLSLATDFGANAILLDAHAPGVYGGTGAVFDWNVANQFRTENPTLPIILAGGIIPENAALASKTVQPSALDIASGAEISPGVKDLKKVAALIRATQA